MAEKEKGLPLPQGICPYCHKPIYIGLAEHELICKFKRR